MHNLFKRLLYICGLSALSAPAMITPWMQSDAQAGNPECSVVCTQPASGYVVCIYSSNGTGVCKAPIPNPAKGQCNNATAQACGTVGAGGTGCGMLLTYPVGTNWPGSAPTGCYMNCGGPNPNGTPHTPASGTVTPLKGGGYTCQ
jgi:hypothetical protein